MQALELPIAFFNPRLRTTILRPVLTMGDKSARLDKNGLTKSELRAGEGGPWYENYKKINGNKKSP